MKKYLTSALIASLFGIANANATEIKSFVGANLGITSAAWTDAAKHMYEEAFDFPTSFLGLGFDGGVKFTKDKMYNCGLTLAYDYISDSKAELTTYYKPYISSVKFGFSIVSATFDSYLRISGTEENREDIVIGFGLAGIKERAYLLPTVVGELNGLEKTEENDTGGAFVFKVGYNSKIDDRWGWNITGRWFVQGGNSDEKDFDFLFNLNIGLRYSF